MALDGEHDGSVVQLDDMSDDGDTDAKDAKRLLKAQYMAVYRADNRDKLREQNRSRAAARRAAGLTPEQTERDNAAKRKYAAANKEKVRESSRQSKAKRKVADPEAYAQAMHEKQIKSYSRNKHKIAERSKAKRKLDPEPSRAVCRRYHAAHKDEINAKVRAKNALNRESVNEKARLWRLANPEKALESGRKNYRKNKVKMNAHSREANAKRRATDPEAVRAYGRKISRKAAGITNATGEQRHGDCPICLKHKKLYCDHDHVTGHIRGWICSGCNMALALWGACPSG